MKRVEVRMHLMICKHCGRYARQLRKMGSAVQGLVYERVEESEAVIRRIEDETIDREEKRSS